MLFNCFTNYTSLHLNQVAIQFQKMMLMSHRLRGIYVVVKCSLNDYLADTYEAYVGI